MEPIIVTSALPYSNDRLHLGHLRSTYLPPDVYVRFLRRSGHDVVFICATDEHGTPIALRAEKEHVNPKDITDRYHPLIKDELQRMGCSFDYFSRTTDPIHYETTQAMFRKLLDKGFIYEQSIELLRCPKCDKYLPDRYVEGTCSYCGFEGARGDSCDSCGRYLRATELKDPKCAICGTKPELSTTKHWFFKLTAFQDELRRWLESNEKTPDNVKKYALGWINEGLKDWDITRDMGWGVPLPIEGTDGKVVYVWFDAPIGYISSTKACFIARGDPEGWKRYWQGNGKIVHFIGKDIIYHHAIFWPAMLMGSGDFNTPEAIIASEYLTLEGKKMSKSRGWFITINDYLRNFSPDPMRYYLISVAPLERDADFSVDEFIKRYNDELADVLGNFIHRTLTFIERFFGGAVPQANLSEGDKAMLVQLEKTQSEVGSAIEQVKFRDGLISIMALARDGNKYLNEAAPWAAMKTDPQKAAATLYTSAQIVKSLGSLLSPYLPFTAERISQILNLEGDIHSATWKAGAEPLPAGHKIGKPEPLFKKIQAEDIPKVKADLIPFKDVGPRIKMDEFKKAKIAVGEVVKAERIKGSRDLLHLEVDIGEYGVRSCVAGIAKYYSPEELVKKKIAVLTNIETTTLFGVKSEVMVLAAEGEEKVSLLVADKLVPPGSGVR
ncbi:MAG: methionine--tRNA ligase [Candidatus Methanomethylicus sp.]|nr:methionine--tRNA ligase [Candidatus Methanomethylicus sp.]